VHIKGYKDKEHGVGQTLAQGGVAQDPFCFFKMGHVKPFKGTKALFTTVEKAFVFLCLIFGSLPACQEDPSRVSKSFIGKGSTKPIRNLTPCSKNPNHKLGMRGTDLGVSFPYQEKLCFLFGDTITFDSDSGKKDCLAFADLDTPSNLSWLTTDTGQFQPLKIDKVSLGVMDVPVEGIVVKNKAYLFFSSGYSKEKKRHAYSVLAHKELKDPSWDLTLDYKRPSPKFINISAEVAPEDKNPDPWIYLFGTGAFRKSSVYLARVRASTIQDPGTYLYYQGLDASTPMFAPDEEKAVPLFPSKQMGELSVVYHKDLKCWLLTYNINHPVSVRLRWSKQPWGPWSKSIEIFNPKQDNGYTHILHSPRDWAGFDDGLSDPGAEPISGGAYGPYMAPSWFQSKAPGLYSIIYTLSTWNPYRVLLMETQLITQDYSGDLKDIPLKTTESLGLKNGNFTSKDLSGWSFEGGPFVVESNRITLKSGDRSKIWQEFLVDHSMKFIEFDLIGRGGSAKLFFDNCCVRRTLGGPKSDSKIRTRWSLSSFISQHVRLEMEFLRGNFAAGPFVITRK